MLLALALAGVLTVGDLRLCGSRVTSATIGSNDYTGEPSLTVKLNAQGQAELARLTRRLVGRTLIIRIGRTELSRPFVNTAIEGGEFDLSDPDLPTLERTRAAALTACPTIRRRAGT